MPTIQEQITKAAYDLQAALSAHPECDARLAEPFIRKNALRPHPLVTITPAYSAPGPKSTTMEERVLAAIIGCQSPIEMLNPTATTLHLGRGPGTLAACFGVPMDAKNGYTAYGARPIEEVLAEGMPSVTDSGIIPEMREHIETILRTAPDFIQIAPPDTQGPFNIAHMVLGDEVFITPYTDPDLFDEFMAMVTDFYIAFYKTVRGWIGEDRYTCIANSRCRLRECSCNLISADMYLEHVLKHDIRIANFFGEVCMHPCSGRHVFKATLDALPGIVYHEAMPFDGALAPSITVEEAVEMIGNRPIQLASSRDVRMKSAEAVIIKDFDINMQHPAFTFFYGIQDATPEDKDAIRAMHARINEAWYTKVKACMVSK